MKRAVLILTAFVVGKSVFLLGHAQPDQKTPAFEVASIKPDRSGDDRAYTTVHPGGRYSVTNTSLKALVLTTYHFAFNRVFGGPSWADTERFDIEAKAPDNANPSQEQLSAMMKTLLADRFQFRAHEESRQLPVYSLEVTKTGTVGSQLKRASSSACVNLPLAGPEKGPRPTVDSNGRPWCGRIVFGPAGWFGRSVTTEQIANALEPFAGRSVFDHTNLRGSFDVDLEFNPRFLGDSANDTGISVFTAVREQLGLKLDSTIGPLNVLVIDHVERPTPD